MRQNLFFQSVCCLLFVFFSCLTAWSETIEDQAKLSPLNTMASKKSILRIASYNVLNLFDGDPQNEPTAKPLNELKALSQVLHDLNADVIALQEVDSLKALTSFRDNFLKDMNYHELVLIKGNDIRGINVALMSRYPVLSVQSHKDLRFAVPGQGLQGFQRDLLQVQIQGPQAFVFTVFVAHFKSKHGENDGAEIKRRAEAEAARDIIRNFQLSHPQEAIALMGDFNDTCHSASLAPLLSPASDLDDILLQELGDGADIYSFHLEPYRYRIDYLLLNAHMKQLYVHHSAKIHRPEQHSQSDQKHYLMEASDHFPVSIDLDLSQALPAQPKSTEFQE